MKKLFLAFLINLIMFGSVHAKEQYFVCQEKNDDFNWFYEIKNGKFYQLGIEYEVLSPPKITPTSITLTFKDGKYIRNFYFNRKNGNLVEKWITTEDNEP